MSSILDIPQIPSIDFVHIQNDLHMGFGGDVKDRLQNARWTDETRATKVFPEPVDALMAAFVLAQHAEDEAYVIAQGSDLTKQRLVKDQERDALYKEIKKTVDTFATLTIFPEKQAAALKMQPVIAKYNILPDGYMLYRRLLASQPDHSVSIVSIGFVTCLSQLLQSEADEYSPLSGVELVRRKVKCIYLMGGVFGKSVEPDFNLSQGLTFASDFFRLWPKEVDMVFSPQEVGENVEYRPEQVISDISWTDAHPIKQVYLKYNCDTGQMMWDPMAVIQAVEGDDLFTLSERGTVSLTPKAETLFTPSATGNCRYQLPGTAQWAGTMLEKIRSANKKH